MKEPTNKVEKNAFAVVCTNSHCEKEMVCAGQQKSPRLYLCFYPCSVTLWTYLQVGNASIMEVNTDWKSLQLFFFYGPEKIIKLATDERTNIEENLNETVKQCLK